MIVIHSVHLESVTVLVGGEKNCKNVMIPIVMTGTERV